MSYPVGVQTVTLRLGSSFDSAGMLAKIEGNVVPLFGAGADHLVWGATGQTYAKVLTKLAWDDTEKVAVAIVPHPTQAGWKDQTQATFSGWSYKISAVAVYASGEPQTFERTITPQPGDTVIDVDLLPNGAAATPTVVAEWEQARLDVLDAIANATEVEQVTLTEDLAYTLPAGVSPNRVHSVVFTQDATGGHTVTFGGTRINVDPAAGSSTEVEVWPGGMRAIPASGAPGAAMATSKASAPLGVRRSPVTVFQAGHGWTITNGGASTNLNDTTDFRLGSQAARIEITSNTQLSSPTLAPIDLTGKQIRLLMKVENMSALTNFRFYAANATFTSYKNYNLGLVEARLNATHLKEGEWSWVTMTYPSGTTTGTDPRAAVTKFRLTCTGAGAIVHINAVEIVPEPVSLFPNGVVSICFDDGRITPYNLARPKMDAMGFPGTYYPIIDRVNHVSGSYMTVAQLRSLRDFSGAEIGVHAAKAENHDAGFDTLTGAQVEAEILTSQEFFWSNGLGVADGIAWPLGVSTRVQEDAAAKLLAYGRGNTTQTRETWPPANNMVIRSQAISSTTTLAQAQAYVLAAKKGRGWTSLTFHDIVASGATGGLEWNKADFDALMDYIAAEDVPVMTISDVMRAQARA